jgi:sarcosine oxidase
MKVIVVGAGIVGLCAAWWLKRNGHTPVVLEQGPLPNPAAASHDHHRLIRLAHGAGDGRGRMIRQAYAAWDMLWSDLGRSHYVENGMLVVIHDECDWGHSCRRGLDEAGHAYEVWDRARLAERCPFLVLGEGSHALFMARGGAILIEQTLRSLLGWLIERGVEVHADSRVEHVVAPAGSVTLADGRRFFGDAVIVAAGAWAPRLLAPMRGVVTPKRNVVLYLEPPAALRAAWERSPCILDFGGPNDLYGVPPIRGLPLKIGSGPHRSDGDPDAPRVLREDEPASLLARIAPSLHDLDAYRVVDHRVCFYAWTDDERFRMGRIADGPVVYATGCSGQMAKFGAVAGQQLARCATGMMTGRALSEWALGEAHLEEDVAAA